VNDNLLTIVFGYKNRDLLRVKRCLDSLGSQSYQGFKVILVDYGSEPDISKKVSELVGTFDFCQYIFSETRGWPWNRSRALNIGIRLSRTKYVMTSDIDLIFDPEFVAQCIKQAGDNIALHAGCFYLPKNFNKWSRLSSLTPTFKQSIPEALGLVLCLTQENYEKVSGFDEFYQFWGVEDRDIEHRLNFSGIETKWLDHSESRLYHQWHPINNNLTFSFLPVGFWEEMEMYFGKNFKHPIRNLIDGWGEVTERNQRPALDLLENTGTATVTFSASKGWPTAYICRKIAETFYSLTAGDSLRIVGDFSHPWKGVLYTVNLLNILSGRLGLGYHISPKRNLLKDAFWLFYRNNMADVRDYAVSEDEKDYYLVRK